MPRIQPLNCLLLLLPLLAWNLLFAGKVSPAYSSDDSTPRLLVWLEHALRAVVFVWPLFFALRIGEPLDRVGLALYAVGVVVYCASWLPQIFAPGSRWSRSLPGFLAPAYTPALWLVGLALLGRSWPYLAAALLFTSVHVLHNVYARRHA
jgi:hypothetical protein